MASDSGLTIRITARLTDLFDELNEPDVLYSAAGRTALVLALKRETFKLMKAFKYEPVFTGVKFHIRLYQWMEGDGASRLPKMRDILNSRVDSF